MRIPPPALAVVDGRLSSSPEPSPAPAAEALWKRQHQQAMAPTLQALRAPPPLRPTEVVLIYTQPPPHCIVYVPWGGPHRGHCLPGKVYSLYYDATHRPYRYSGRLPKRLAQGGSRDVAARWLARNAERWAHAPAASQALGEALAGLAGQTFPTRDLFLHALHDAIAERLPSVDLNIHEDILRDCCADLMRCNDLPPMVEREICPLAALDDPQLRRDQQDAWASDERLRQGRRPRRKVQPISHEALRLAYRRLLVGMWYLDERLQRSEGCALDAVLSKPWDVDAACARHNERVRAAALVALAEPLGVRDPRQQQRINARRRLQARQIAAQRDFPVFADAPWRVQSGEAQQLRLAHNSFFRALPRAQWEPPEGNCNAAAFALLRLAAEEQQGLDQADAPTELRGGTGWRTYGAKYPLRLPYGGPVGLSLDSGV